MQARQLIKQKIKGMCVGLGILSVLLSTQGIVAKSSMEFNDVTATVMINSLAPLEKSHFLRQLYTELFFVPVWIQEENLSSLSQELFKHIQEDKTLLRSSKLKQDALALAQKSREVYPSGTVAQKVDLEFRISQLYKGYIDYALYGSINWGAF